MSAVALVDGVVCTGDAVLTGHAVVVEAGRIAAVVPAAAVPGDARRLGLDGAYVAPGLVDLQVNGGGDVLFGEQPDAAGLGRILAAHRRLGTTSLMPTLTSAPAQVVAAALEAVHDGVRAGVPGLLGLHLEGPFLAPERAGAHDRRHLRTMTAADADRLAAPGGPALVTLAPERVPPVLVGRLAAAGVHVSAGHSAAEPPDLDAAVRHGLRFVTHLFNAMSGIRARAPGLAGAALADDRVACGLIADGHHVAPAAIALALRCKPAGRLFLVSDAMPPVGGGGGRFRLGGVDVSVRAGRCVTTEGVLAGSAAPLAEGVRRLAGLGVPVPEALRMASTVPADLIGRGSALGRLAPGRTADVVIVGPDGALRRVMLGGAFA